MTRASVTSQHLRERRAFLGSLVLLLVLVVACAGLTACGGPTTAPIIGRNCGRVHQGLDWVLGDASGPESCLWQAYVHCETATLVFEQTGTDIDNVHAITVQSKHGVCMVSDAVQTGVPGTVFPITSYSCAGLQQLNGGLITTCGSEGTVMMPLFPALIGKSCGKVVLMANGMTVGSPDAVACFAHAYQTCQAATLVYTRPIPGLTGIMETHFVSFERENGICAVSDVDQRLAARPDMVYRRYLCAALQPQPDGGLVVSSCGAEGDIDIPSSSPTPTPTILPTKTPASH